MLSWFCRIVVSPGRVIDWDFGLHEARKRPMSFESCVWRPSGPAHAASVSLKAVDTGSVRRAGNVRGGGALLCKLSGDVEPVNSSGMAQPVHLSVDLESLGGCDRNLEQGREIAGRCVDDYLMPQGVTLNR